jgi:hypothetical protein
MPMHRRQHLRTAWLALLLFALATLTPTVSRAMAHVQGQIAPWATLCSAADAASRTGPADALHHLTEHCPACHLQADHLAPPPPDCAHLALQPAAALLPVAAAAAAAAALPWTRGQPRAPPSAH